MATEALSHYKCRNRWKSIFENVTRWHKVKLERLYKVCVSLNNLNVWIQAASSLKEASSLKYNKQMIFGDDKSANFYLHHYHHWTYNSEVHNFETHIYTDNVREGVDILYWRLFCVYINYVGVSTHKEELFAIFTTYHNTLYISHSSYCIY